MAMRKPNRFTIYDMMEAKGMFDNNPANAGAIDSDGAPIHQIFEYPKMLYHPNGETRIIVPGEWISTPGGAKFVGEQKEIIWQIVNSTEEETLLVSQGWHTSPGGAVVAGGGVAPPKSLNEQLEDLKRELAAVKAEQISKPTVSIEKKG